MSNWEFTNLKEQTAKYKISKYDKQKAIRNDQRKIYEQALAEGPMSQEEDNTLLIEANHNRIDLNVIDANHNRIDLSSFVPTLNDENTLLVDANHNRIDLNVIDANHNRIDLSSFVPALNEENTLLVDANHNRIDLNVIDANHNRIDLSSFVPALNEENTLLVDANHNRIDLNVIDANHNRIDLSSFVPALNEETTNLDMIIEDEVESDTESNFNQFLNDGYSSQSNDSDTESLNENLENYFNKYDKHEKEIYAHSNIKYKHFVAIYIKEFVGLDLSNEIHNKFLKFLRVILPSDGLNLPKTYKSLVKSYKLPSVVNKKLCAKCSKELEKHEECQEASCIHFKNTRENRGKKDPYLIEFNIEEQLKSLIAKHWQTIQEYRNVLSSNQVSDICNSNLYNSYHLTQNTISLLLFIDGAPFSKSDKGSVWAILGIIANLPPLIRSSFKNMFKICFINGKLFNFNGIYDNHLNKFKNVLQFGINININGQITNIKLTIHALIADNPGRAKAGNFQQHNGTHGCFHCLSVCFSHNGKKYIFFIISLKLYMGLNKQPSF
jgi:hypothetical protein